MPKLMVLAALLLCAGVDASRQRQLPLGEFRDKLAGGWVGQMVGVSYGSVYEFRAVGSTYDGPIREWQPEFISNALGQDDLYVEMTFLMSLDKHGVGVSQRQAALDFAGSQYALWHANRWGRDNIRKGIMPPASGHPRFNLHADDIDFQIEADLFGLVCPGLPQASNRLCDRFGHLMNYGDGVYGGMFVAACYTAAYFERDVEKVVRSGLSAIPSRSRYAAVIRDVLAWYRENPGDWRQTWRKLESKWAGEDKCPDGAGKPFNIDAKMNGAYVVIALLYGGGDFEKTMEIAVRCGQDADCNASSAAGILGTILGYKRIPERFTAGLREIRGRNFAYTPYSFDTLAAVCERIAKDIVRGEGGQVIRRGGREVLLIAVQAPKPPQRLEQWVD